MAETLWKDCVTWLVECQVLPSGHRVTWPDAQLIDLARTLEDGELLCQLLHVLKPACLDLRAINPKPKMSEFLCLKNVNLFLDTCQTHFGMKISQLFEPAMLCGLGDFFKVLESLSHLSKTQAVQARGFPYFPKEVPKNQVEYYNMDSFRGLDDIERLEDDELEDDHFDEQTETSKTEAHIYEDLCYVKIPSRRPDELPEPKDKRDHCIRELLDTERNYLDALEMIVGKFMKPIRNVLTADDVLTIFVNIEDLTLCHAGFYADLRRACQNPMHFERHLTEAFERCRMKFTMYGRYCAELPKAQRRLDELCAKNEVVNQAVKKCQNETNDGKFRLRDLLSVPMQRILKYHLLLKELKKHSMNLPEEEQANVGQALMIMVDVAMYINEVKRDSEMIDMIRNIEDSIVDLQMPENLHLTSYGHLHIDGVVRFRPHESTSPKTRHIFVFDRVMLIVKPAKAAFSYKDALIMDEFRVDESVPTKPAKDKWSHQWHVFNFKDHRLAYTMAVKTEAERKRWIEAIKLALNNLSPPDLKESSTHHPVFASFGEPTLCVVCDRLLRGTFYQGYRCSACNQAVHKECLGQFRDCGKPNIRSRPVSSLPTGGRRPSSSTFSTASTMSLSRSPHSASMGAFSPSSRSSFDFVGLRKSASDLSETRNSAHKTFNQENEMSLPVPSRNSVASPVSPNPTSPFNPFSPATHGRFTYKTAEEELMSVYPWFAGHMDREKSEEFLQRFSNGTFLIRISSKGEPYKVISVRYDDKPRHIRILHTPEQTCYLAPIKFFKSVPELVGWYESHSLADSFQGMNCTLRIPYKKALLPQDSASTSGVIHPRAIVRYNFSATSPNMLTIKVGDEVEILGRSGEQRGWWKGKSNGKVGYFPLSYVEELQAQTDASQTHS